ncbi:hypothetical protein XENOCAPTIV_012658, partial [Xenoophorus captivus]
KETSQKIIYFLTGPGVDEDPKGRFAVDRDTGFVRVFSILDREEIAQYKTLNLAVKVKNEAEYNFGSSMSITGASQSKSYPIKINVINQKEGPRFHPSVKVVTVSGDKTSISLNKTIVTLEILIRIIDFPSQDCLIEQAVGQGEGKKSSQGSQQHQEKDAELIYDYEGRGSLAGSVGCCSLLENDNDLAFLNELGPKFKTLAEICLGTTLESTSVDAEVSDLPNQMASPIRPSTSTHTHVHTHTETIRDRDHLNLNTINISNKAAGSSTIIQKERITETSQGSATLPKVQETVVIPNQTLLIQQPAMYYAATPMYVVETKPQMVLVSGGTQQVVGQVGQAGLSQGLIQVGGLQGSQGVMLVEGQVEINGAPRQVAQGLSQGTVSKSTEVFVVKNGSADGKHSTHYTQSSGEILQRSLEAGLEMGGKGVHVKSFSAGSHGSAGSKEEFALSTTPRFQGQRVVVQQKKVSVTERNLESGT